MFSLLLGFLLFVNFFLFVTRNQRFGYLTYQGEIESCLPPRLPRFQLIEDVFCQMLLVTIDKCVPTISPAIWWIYHQGLCLCPNDSSTNYKYYLWVLSSQCPSADWQGRLVYSLISTSILNHHSVKSSKLFNCLSINLSRQYIECFLLNIWNHRG